MLLSSRAFLSNGLVNKEPPIDSALQTVNSTQATWVDDLELPSSNGTDDLARHPNSSQSAADLHTSFLESTEAVAIAPPSDPPPLEEVAPHSATGLDDSTLKKPSPPLQAPLSDLREAAQPISLEQTADIKEEKLQQDLERDPHLANGLTAGPHDIMDRTNERQQLEPVIESEVAAGLTAPALSSENKVEPAIVNEAPVSIPSQNIPHHPSVPVPEGAELEAPLDPAPSPVIAMPEIPVALPVVNPKSTSIQHSMSNPGSPSFTVPPASRPPDQSAYQDAQTVAAAQEPLISDSMVDPSNSDQVMQDVPPSPSKVGREREDDDVEDGPAAKRSKTDDGSAAPEFKVPDLPEINTNVNGTNSTSGPTDSSNPMTKLRHKFTLKVIQNIKRTQAAIPFNQPVDVVALKIPNYLEVIKRPMDLRTMEESLKANTYTSVDDFVADFNQIVENSRAFNGIEHVVTKSAYNIKASFDKQMINLPGPDVVEPTPADKKKKQSISAASKVAPPRRESRSSLPGPARSPTAGPSQTFALGPQGVPLIRRDSTVDDGRPKREIHPPAPRDLPYANHKPKKKKYQWELKFCQYIIDELTKPKYGTIAYPFLVAVDPVAQNIPNYHKIIKNPMDLGTVRSKLSQGQYENAKEFEVDIRLIFQNCYKFNGAGHAISAMAKQLEGIFDNQWKQKGSWIDSHAPASGPQSPGSSPGSDEDDEDEEEDEEEEDDDSKVQLSKLQQQIAAMSKQVEMIQKKKSPPASSKKSKSTKPEKKASKKRESVSSAKSVKAPSASKLSKTSKLPYVTYEQKQDISNRINSLSETRMATALRIIRDNMPNLKVRIYISSIIKFIENFADLELYLSQGVQDDELELDIDELSNEVLHKLLTFVRKHAPRPEDSPVPRTVATAPSGPTTKKKNKPMSSYEQEAQISAMRNKLSAFKDPDSQEAPESCKCPCSRSVQLKKTLVLIIG